MSGATIMAPMTVAVESAITPAVAMTAARVSRIQNFEDIRPRSGPSMYRVSVIRRTSAGVTVMALLPRRCPGRSLKRASLSGLSLWAG